MLYSARSEELLFGLKSLTPVPFFFTILSLSYNLFFCSLADTIMDKGPNPAGIASPPYPGPPVGAYPAQPGYPPGETSGTFSFFLSVFLYCNDAFARVIPVTVVHVVGTRGLISC